MILGILSTLGTIFAALVLLLLAGFVLAYRKWALFRARGTRSARRGPSVIETEFADEE